jgi:hypothetical protein
MSTSLIKPGLRTALAEALYQEVLTNSNNYYYFLGDTLTWADEDNPPLPQVTSAYEKYVRQEMIFVKKITAADVAFTIDRYDWAEGEVYDKYDDLVGHSIVISNCSGTVDVDNGISYITTTSGSFDASQIAIGYTVIGTGIATGAKVTSVQSDRVAVSIAHTGTVSGSVTFMNITPSGAENIENAKMYCVTSENRVYKCLDNNGAIPSTSKPYSTSLQPITTPDGYVWKYMYTIPAALINKFMTETELPVTTSIKNQFYTRGSLSTIAIDSYGVDYQVGDQLTVSGDGYLTDNKIKILSAVLGEVGSGYVSAPNVTVSDPFPTVPWESNKEYLLGQYVKTTQNKIYEVASPGVSDESELLFPVHTGPEPVINGTVSFRFVGLTPSITATISGTGEVDGIVMTGIIGYLPITVPGYGYDSANPPSVVVSSVTGSGAQATARVVNGRVANIVVTDRGDGYGADPINVVIDSPFADGVWVDWLAGNTVSVGDIVRVSDEKSIRYYETIEAGLLGTPSTITSTTQEFVSNTATMKFVGQGAQATAELYYGFGYTATPTAVVDYPIEFNDVPLVTPWIPSTVDNPFMVSTGDVVEYEGRFYEVTAEISNAVMNTTPPVHASGTEDGFGLENDISLTFIASTATVSFLDTKTQARVVPVIENGQIVSVIIDDPGVGYTNASIIVEAFEGGRGASLRPITSYGDLESRQANVELLAVPGTIDCIDIVNPGSGYTGTPSVTIQGDGEGATAVVETVTVGTDTAITKLRITNRGSGYTYAHVTIAPPDHIDPLKRSQAYARAIVSPVQGHGKNAINELYATNISLSSTISTEKNQGIDVSNDYRQLGVIKNPYQYGTQLRFSGSTGSTCFAITGEFDSPENDMELYDQDFDEEGNPQGNKFRVVAISTSGTLSTLVIQSLDNAGITNSQMLYYKKEEGDPKSTTIVSRYTSPSVDKYSGEIMFIDNREAFLPRPGQVISLKTVIKL